MSIQKTKRERGGSTDTKTQLDLRFFHAPLSHTQIWDEKQQILHSKFRLQTGDTCQSPKRTYLDILSLFLALTPAPARTQATTPNNSLFLFLRTNQWVLCDNFLKTFPFFWWWWWRLYPVSIRHTFSCPKQAHHNKGYLPHKAQRSI